MSLNRTLAGIINTAGDVKSASLDNVSTGLTVYATLNDLPTTGLTSGDQAYVSSTSRFYISNGSGWYNVALVNATPNLTISPSGTIELDREGNTTTITLTGTDSDYPDAGLTYSVESDGSFYGLGTLSQDSSVFTITPRSEDSATTTSAVLTFKASDQISFGSGSRTLTLEFSVANTRYTTLLLQADVGTDAQVDASSNSYTLTKYGTPVSTAVSPYHPGGYSTYFDGTGDYLTTATSSDFTYGTGDFTLECWVYITAAPTYGSTPYRYILAQGHNTTVGCGLYIQENNFRFFTNATRVLDGTASGTQYALNQWQHIAVSRSGGTIKLFVDGVEAASATNSTNITTGTANGVTVGRWHEIGDGGYFLGYIRDVRVVKGTGVYTSAFTPPSKPLTAIANTKFLACHNPSLSVDGSTSDHTITINGNTHTKRFAPYDYLSYNKSEYGGSTYFDGNGDYYIAPFSITGESNITVEAWIYMQSIGSHNIIYNQYPNANASSYPGRHLFYVGTSDNKLSYWVADDGTAKHSEVLTLNTWYHVAVVRSGNTITLYVNGKGETSGITFDRAIYSENINLAGESHNSNYFDGYMTDLRITYNSTTYTGDFTPPTAPLTSGSDTKLLTFTNKNDMWDASGVSRIAKVNSIAALGTKSGWTGNAIYFNRNSSQYMTLPAQEELKLGTGDFTIETWVFFNAIDDFGAMFDFRNTGTQVAPLLWAHYDNYFYWYINGSTRIQGANDSIASGTWYHVAVARSNSVTKMFVNGTQVGNNYADTNNYLCPGSVYIGRSAVSNDHHLHGYLIDARVTKGLARYTGNFTPPTTDFGG